MTKKGRQQPTVHGSLQEQPQFLSKNTHTPNNEDVLADLEIISATQLRTETRDVMERVRFNGERFVVETFGHRMAVIISVNDFLRVKDVLIAVQEDSTSRNLGLGSVVDSTPQHKSHIGKNL